MLEEVNFRRGSAMLFIGNNYPEAMFNLPKNVGVFGIDK
jgi:hypothetical protein